MKKFFAALLLSISSFLVMADNEEVQEEVRVSLVELDVKVTTLGGRTIKGLTPADFVVKEKGVIQDIESFEEVDIAALPVKEAEAYQSRIMILLDFRNTSFGNMHRVFPQLRKYVNELYKSHSEVGLAVNSDGIGEIQSFTSDKELLLNAIEDARVVYRNSRNRTIHPHRRYAHNNDFARGFARVSHGFYASHFSHQLEILGQFVNYLGGFTGKKSVILFSDEWQTGNLTDAGSTSDAEGVVSLKDIQTASLFNKISINVINPSQNSSNYGADKGLLTYQPPYIQQQRLAAVTAGLTYSPNSQGIANVIDEIFEKSENFYRIRYYTNSSGDKYRRVRVTARGAGRVAHSLAGYYPQTKTLNPTTGKAQLTTGKASHFDLEMETDWMYWELSGFKRKAYYAIAQRAFGRDNQLISETVIAGNMVKNSKKSRKSLVQTLEYDKALVTKATRYEVVVIDLITGKRVVLKDTAKGNLI